MNLIHAKPTPPFQVATAWLGPTPSTGNLKDLLGAITAAPTNAVPYNDITTSNRRRKKRSITDSYDLRDNVACHQVISTIRNQGGCGACWAFAAAGVMTDALCMASGGQAKEFLSPMHLTACCNSELLPASSFCVERACGGGSAARAMDFFRNYGVVTGTDYDDELINGYGTGCYPYEFTGEPLTQFSSESRRNSPLFSFSI